MDNKNNKPDSYEQFRKQVIREVKKEPKKSDSKAVNKQSQNPKKSHSDKKIPEKPIHREKSKLNVKSSRKFEDKTRFLIKNNINREKEKEKIKSEHNAVAKKKKLHLSPIDIERKKIINKKNKVSKGLVTHKKRKKRIKSFIAGVLTIAVVVCVAVVLKTFFNVEEIIVEGQTRYNTNKIISLCGINIGENIFFCSSSDGSEKIQSVMPYIDNVQIKRKLPNKIVINVSETTAQYAVEYNNDYLLVSSGGKILERTGEKPNDLLILRGLNIKNSELAANIEQTDENSKNAVKAIMDSIKENNFNEITMIDLSLLSNIRVYYDNRIAIVIGISQNVDYKLRNAYNIIKTRLSSDVEGILDVSISDGDYKTSYFTEQSLASVFGSSSKNNNSNTDSSDNPTDNTSSDSQDNNSDIKDSENNNDTTTSIEPNADNDTSSYNDRYTESEYYGISNI